MAPVTGAIRVREASPEDWPAVASLLAELGRPDVRGLHDEDEHMARYRSYLGRSDAVGLVADLDGDVVGFVDVEFRQRLNFATPQAWVPDLIVAERARGSGVGAALMARAEELSRERGCWGMTLESATWRTDAHRFYQREGWRNTAHSYTKPLTDVPWPPSPPDEGG
jgi:GNAT superfamily N-acetyltransferase